MIANRFFSGHCFDDYTIQCCVDEGLGASTEYDQPWYEGDGDQYGGNPDPGEAVVVPTIPNNEAIIVPTIPTFNDNTVTIPMFERPVVVPTIDRDRDWRKRFWDSYIARAYIARAYGGGTNVPRIEAAHV